MQLLRRSKGLIFNLFKEKDPFHSLKKLPRYTQVDVELLGNTVTIADNLSFLFMYKEIFQNQVYKFRTTRLKPVIIDGGANIGLSTIFFKTNYPDAKVVAFEPDFKIFNMLKKNLESFGFDDVLVINKGLWNEEGILTFNSEGADAGRIHDFRDEKVIKTAIETCCLSTYLKQPIELLKLDIEGAETEVLEESQSLLHNVNKIFVEYHSFADQPQTLYKILRILQEQNFRIHINTPGFIAKQPFFNCSKLYGMDMQLNIFGFRQ
jgi:FkbM family methyltransferase